MILEDEILKLETRREIYNFILEYPGLHLREISRRTNIPLGSLGYYIKSLKKYGLIETKKDQKYNQGSALESRHHYRYNLFLLSPFASEHWGHFQK